MTLRAVAPGAGGGGGDAVESVTGTMVDNTDPKNPVIGSDNTKLNVATGTSRVYAINGSGTQTTLPYSAGTVGSTIATRTADGTLRASSPIDNGDLTTKAYVDARTVQMPAIADATDEADAVIQLNALLAALRTAGYLAT